MPVSTVPQDENCAREGCTNEAINEEAIAALGEAHFYTTIDAFQILVKSGKWGPQVWKTLDKESKMILVNMALLESMNMPLPDFTKKEQL